MLRSFSKRSTLSSAWENFFLYYLLTLPQRLLKDQPTIGTWELIYEASTLLVSKFSNWHAGLSALFQLHSISSRRQHYSQAATAGGDTLLIVESPAKAKKIQKFLGPAYEVRDLLTHLCPDATNLQACQRSEGPSKASSSSVPVCSSMVPMFWSSSKGYLVGLWLCKPALGQSKDRCCNCIERLA